MISGFSEIRKINCECEANSRIGQGLAVRLARGANFREYWSGFVMWLGRACEFCESCEMEISRLTSILIRGMYFGDAKVVKE